VGFDGGVRVVVVPVEEVRVIPVTTTLKLSSEGLAGGVSATIVRLTLAVPPPQLLVHGPLGTPLQEAKKKNEVKAAANGKNLLKFIKHPTEVALAQNRIRL